MIVVTIAITVLFVALITGLSSLIYVDTHPSNPFVLGVRDISLLASLLALGVLLGAWLV